MNKRHPGLVLSVAILTIGLGSVLLASNATETILAGDPPEFRARVQAILDGGLPYLDVPLEHLPIMLVPMFGAWILGGFISQSDYVLAFAGLMIVSLGATAMLMLRIGVLHSHASAATRWLALVAPLVPLVVFRNDPFVTLLFVLSVYLTFAERTGSTMAAVVGALAKIWPAALALLAFRRAAMLRAAVLAISGAVGLGWTFLPGFVGARSGLGIHAETAMGALLGLWRTSSGGASQVVLTTAAYLPADAWVVALNALLGLLVLVVGVKATLKAPSPAYALLGVGTAVAGIILTSQLFSLQYVLWLTPFLAWSRGRHVLAIGLGLSVVTLGLAWSWTEGQFEEPLFYIALCLRNLAVFFVAFLLAREATIGIGSPVEIGPYSQ